MRHELFHDISQHIHYVVPGSGGNTFHQTTTAGINDEYIKTCDSPQIRYRSVEHYCTSTHGKSRHTYATHIEIVPANQLFNIQIRLTFAGHPHPLPPGPNTCDLLLHIATSVFPRYSVRYTRYLVIQQLLMNRFTHTPFTTIVFVHYTGYQQLPNSQIFWETTFRMSYCNLPLSNAVTHASCLVQQELWVCYLHVPF